MGDNGGVTECIHGLEIGDCEACTPRPTPGETGAARPSERTRRPAGTTRPVATKAAPDVAVRAADNRRYLVVGIDELEDVLGVGPLTESDGWGLQLDAPTTRDQVVLVSALGDPDDIQLLGVANEPARRRVFDELRRLGRTTRVAVNPSWFA